jgi:hypothetical protein
MEEYGERRTVKELQEDKKKSCILTLHNTGDAPGNDVTHVLGRANAQLIKDTLVMLKICLEKLGVLLNELINDATKPLGQCLSHESHLYSLFNAIVLTNHDEGQHALLQLNLR